MALKDWKKEGSISELNITFTNKYHKLSYIWIYQSNFPIKNRWNVKIDTRKSLGLTHGFSSSKAALNYSIKYMKKYSD